MDLFDLKAIVGILVEVLNQPSTTEEQEVVVVDAPDWRSLIIEYLKSPIVETDSQLAKLKIGVARYTLIDEVLYKRSFSLPYLRCLGSDEAQYALREIHKGFYGQYMSGHSLSYKALRQGYYWPTMKKDAADLVKKCNKCQRFTKTTHKPPEQLSNVVVSWPFA